MTRFLSALLAACLIAPTAMAQEASVEIGPSFSTSSSGWTNGIAGKLIISWDVVALEGRPMVCGAYNVTNVQLIPPVRNMIRQGAVTVDGEPAIEGLSFFNRVNRARTEAQMAGKTAGCVALPASVNGQSRIGLTFGSGRFRN